MIYVKSFIALYRRHLIMELIKSAIEVILHLDKYIGPLISTYGMLVYLIMFIIAFCETGLVVTPFLPGDSMLFTAGALAAAGSLKVELLLVIFAAAGILGDCAAYLIGRYFGPKLIRGGKSKFINAKELEKAKKHFEKYGGRTVFISRFLPVLRSLTPFVAGAGKMRARKFLMFNSVGGILWALLYVLGGFFFGNIKIVKDNFSFVIIGIVCISITPGIIAYIKRRKK